MPTFTWRAATSDGRVLRGVEDDVSAAVVEHALRARGLFPLEVSGGPAVTVQPGRPGWSGRRASVAEAIRFLATLVDAGFPLDRALGTVARVAARQDVADAMMAVRARVRAGAPLATAMAEHPRLFPRLAIGMARAGEHGGHLAEALTRLAEQLERERALRARVASAMIYPVVMLVAGVAAVAVLMVFVLPRLVGLIVETGAPLPRSTAFLLAAGKFARQHWPVIAAMIAMTAAALAAVRRTDRGGAAIDRFLLRVPVLGPLRRQLAAARLGRALATLLGSGLPAMAALDVASYALADRAATAEVRRAREEVRAGGNLAPALARGGIFPFLFVQMAEVGEDSGRLDEMLGRAAEAMEQSLQHGLDRLVRLAEPLLIILFGGIVGFVAVALLRAIYGVHARAF